MMNNYDLSAANTSSPSSSTTSAATANANNESSSSAVAAAAVAAASSDFVEITDPQTGSTFYANILTGECTWDRPQFVKPKDPDMLEWWELYDENHKLPYFYNTKTGETEWVRPSLGVVIPLVAIQNSKIGKRVSMSIKRASIIHSFDSPNASSIPSYALGGSTDILGRGSSTDLLGRGSSNDLMLKSSNPDLQSVEGPNYTYQQGSPKVPLGIKTSDQHQLAKELDSLDMQSPIKDSVMQQHHSFRDSSALATKSSSSPKVPHHMYPENHDQQFMQQPRISSANVADSSPSGSGAPPPPPPPPPPPVPTLGSNGKFYSIGDPVNNPDAAAKMNPFAKNVHNSDSLNSLNSEPGNDDSASEGPRALPTDLKSNIEKFKIDGFASKYFSEHRQGLFRRRVPIEKMLHWQKESLKAPLMVLNKSVHKDALKCFKLIQRIMGDRAPSTKSIIADDIQTLTNFGILHGELRDEIYVQLCKQVSNNPNNSLLGNSIVKGWQLFCVLVIGFPPSKNLEDYMKSFVRSQFDPAIPHPAPVNNPATLSTGEAVNQICRHCAKKLDKICKTGPRGKPLAIAEIERAMEAPYKINIFGETLEEVMRTQLEADFAGKKEDVPRLLPFLTKAILSLNGCKTEGIFRVPGDADAVTELRCRIEKGNYDLTGITDPNTPSSLLKLWLRELAQPLIPAEFYQSCITTGADEGQQDANQRAIQLVESLPEINRKVVLFMIKFLKIVGDSENIPVTKMSHQNIAMVFAPNFLRCPSDNPTVIFENTKFEQAFLRLLFANKDI